MLLVINFNNSTKLVESCIKRAIPTHSLLSINHCYSFSHHIYGDLFIYFRICGFGCEVPQTLLHNIVNLSLYLLGYQHFKVICWDIGVSSPIYCPCDHKRSSHHGRMEMDCKNMQGKTVDGGLRRKSASCACERKINCLREKN